MVLVADLSRYFQKKNYFQQQTNRILQVIKLNRAISYPRGARRERERENVQGALVVIVSKQPVLCFCMVFLVYFFHIIFYCLDLPPPGASLLMNRFDLAACLESNLLKFLSRICRQELQVEMSRWHVVERFLHNLGEQTGQPNTTASAAARGFTEAILEAAQTVLPTERRIPRMPEWCESPETRAAVEEALAKRRKARRLMKSNRTPATWKALRAAYKGVRAAIDEGIHAHLERYVTRLEALYEDRDLRGLYKHLKKSVGLGGRQSGGNSSLRTRTVFC